MDKDLISIIIVNHNGRKWLSRLFNSLLAQTCRDFEIIFVDNASTDGSVEYLHYHYQDKRIRIVNSDTNLGFAKGNNLGISKCSGECILLLNSDVWIEDDFLDRLQFFYKHNEFDVVAPYETDYFGQKEFIKYTITIDLLGHPIYLKKSPDKMFYMSGACLFFAKRLYQESLGLDNGFFMYFEEIDWFWRLNLLKKNFSYVDGLFVYHAGAGSTGGGLKYDSFLWRNQNTLQMLLKNYKISNLFWILPLYVLQNIFEMIFFFIILKPEISYSYIEGWRFNMVNLKRIIREREWVQKNRLTGDREVLRMMYPGAAKARHLFTFFKKYGKSL